MRLAHRPLSATSWPAQFDLHGHRLASRQRQLRAQPVFFRRDDVRRVRYQRYLRSFRRIAWSFLWKRLAFVNVAPANAVDGETPVVHPDFRLRDQPLLPGQCLDRRMWFSGRHHVAQYQPEREAVRLVGFEGAKIDVRGYFRTEARWAFGVAHQELGRQ